MFHVKQFVEKRLARFSIIGTLSIAVRNLKQVEKKRGTLHQKAVANDHPPFFLNNTKSIKNAEAREEKSETAQLRLLSTDMLTFGGRQACKNAIDVLTFTYETKARCRPSCNSCLG